MNVHSEVQLWNVWAICRLYRLSLDTRKVDPLVLDVPATDLMNERPIVYADNDSGAPELGPGINAARRPLIVCDNLDVSADGKRIYFSEPFDYANATVDDALDEALALPPNGRLWRYDIESDTTRLIAEGFHFINGVLYDLHPGQPREESVLVTQYRAVYCFDEAVADVRDARTLRE